MAIHNPERGAPPNIRLVERARAAASSGSLSETVARDLASSRREVAALRRENERLRTQLASAGAAATTAASPMAAGERAAMRCRRCGRRLDGRAAAHDRVLVLAGCCPECDGPLVPVAGEPDPSIEPSTYLG